ncbi:hypothetical protein WCP94_002608 [Bilophila wadsworthia]
MLFLYEKTTFPIQPGCPRDPSASLPCSPKRHETGYSGSAALFFMRDGLHT